MPIYRINDQVVFFVHIPKTGGTSIEHALETLGPVALRKKVEGIPCPAQHFHAAIYRALVPAGFYDRAFTLCRNPYARLISEYRYHEVHGKVGWLGIDHWVERAFSRYRSNPFVHHNHIRPQVEFLDDRVEILRFEDGLGEALSKIGTWLNLPSPPVPPHEKKYEKRDIFIRRKTVEKIRNFYAEDFERLAYPSNPEEVLEAQLVKFR